MPCYQVIRNSVVFRVENIDLLKSALSRSGYQVFTGLGADRLTFRDNNYNQFEVSLRDSKISSTIDAKQLGDISNSIKRAYSTVVLEEIAKKQKWNLKKMNEQQYQLQRF